MCSAFISFIHISMFFFISFSRLFGTRGTLNRIKVKNTIIFPFVSHQIVDGVIYVCAIKTMNELVHGAMKMEFVVVQGQEKRTCHTHAHEFIVSMHCQFLYETNAK